MSTGRRQELRLFEEAALRAYFGGGRASSVLAMSFSAYCPVLGRFYMWSQTAGVVYVACHLPTGAWAFTNPLLIRFPIILHLPPRLLHPPSGLPDTPVEVEAVRGASGEFTLRIQSSNNKEQETGVGALQCSMPSVAHPATTPILPVVFRTLAHGVDSELGVETFR